MSIFDSYQMDAVTSYGLEFPVSVWMKKVSSSKKEPRVIVIIEPVERSSGYFRIDLQVTLPPLFPLPFSLSPPPPFPLPSAPFPSPSPPPSLSPRPFFPLPPLAPSPLPLPMFLNVLFPSFNYPCLCSPFSTSFSSSLPFLAQGKLCGCDQWFANIFGFEDSSDLQGKTLFDLVPSVTLPPLAVDSKKVS